MSPDNNKMFTEELQNGQSSVSELQVIRAFCGTFPVTEKVIYTFLYCYVMLLIIVVIFRKK